MTRRSAPKRDPLDSIRSPRPSIATQAWHWFIDPPTAVKHARRPYRNPMPARLILLAQGR